MYLIRYGELALKSKQVRRKFEDILIRNIKSVLEKEGKKTKTTNIYGRFLIETNENLDEELKRIFGIVSFSSCLKTNSNLEEIQKLSLEIIELKKGETFAVRCNRTGQHPFSSKDIEKEIGSSIVQKFGNKVNLSKPDKTFWIDVRNNDTYLYTEVIDGPGGLPIGTAGRVSCNIEDFKDIIASWLFMKRGCEVVFSGEYPKVLERWNSGRTLIFVDDHNFEKEKCLATVKGDVEIKKWKDNSFRPLIGLSKEKINELTQRIKN